MTVRTVRSMIVEREIHQVYFDDKQGLVVQFKRKGQQDLFRSFEVGKTDVVEHCFTKSEIMPCFDGEDYDYDMAYDAMIDNDHLKEFAAILFKELLENDTLSYHTELRTEDGQLVTSESVTEENTWTPKLATKYTYK